MVIVAKVPDVSVGLAEKQHHYLSTGRQKTLAENIYGIYASQRQNARMAGYDRRAVGVSPPRLPNRDSKATLESRPDTISDRRQPGPLQSAPDMLRW